MVLIVDFKGLLVGVASLGLYVRLMNLLACHLLERWLTILFVVVEGVIRVALPLAL
jgi:hypothetical protein